MLIYPTPSHHIIVSSISSIPVASVYPGLQAGPASTYFTQLLCDDQIVVLSVYDLRDAKHLFDALCLALGRDRFAISFCSSAMYNKVPRPHPLTSDPLGRARPRRPPRLQRPRRDPHLRQRADAQGKPAPT